MIMDKIELTLSLCVILLFLSLVGVGYHQHTVLEPKAYAAWVKLTGNPSDLTLEEWRVLYCNSQAPPPFVYTPQ
jgi:hypothetical protein